MLRGYSDFCTLETASQVCATKVDTSTVFPVPQIVKIPRQKAEVNTSTVSHHPKTSRSQTKHRTSGHDVSPDQHESWRSGHDMSDQHFRNRNELLFYQSEFRREKMTGLRLTKTQDTGRLFTEAWRIHVRKLPHSSKNLVWALLAACFLLEARFHSESRQIPMKSSSTCARKHMFKVKNLQDARSRNVTTQSTTK